MKKTKQNIFIILFSYIVYNLSNINSSFARILTNDAASPDQFNAFNNSAGYDTTASVGSIMAVVIKAFLGLLGVIFIFLMVLAGYNWMTAAGDEQKVEKAKNEIKRAIIGLVIITSAYAISYFVFKALGGTTSGGMTTSG